MQHTEKGSIYTEVVLEIFKLSGLLVASGDRLVKITGLTSARWKVLGALSISSEPVTVARIAESMGQSRQGVQRIVNDMTREGMVRFQENPNHKRAKLIVITEKGQKAYQALNELQVPWANKNAEKIGLEDMRQTLKTLHKMTEQLL